MSCGSYPMQYDKISKLVFGSSSAHCHCYLTIKVWLYTVGGAWNSSPRSDLLDLRGLTPILHASTMNDPEYFLGPPLKSLPSNGSYFSLAAWLRLSRYWHLSLGLGLHEWRWSGENWGFKRTESWKWNS